jgi:hypothetical protein
MILRVSSLVPYLAAAGKVSLNFAAGAILAKSDVGGQTF